MSIYSTVHQVRLLNNYPPPQDNLNCLLSFKIENVYFINVVIFNVYADTFTSVGFCKIFSDNSNQSLKTFSLTQDKIKGHLSTCVLKWFSDFDNRFISLLIEQHFNTTQTKNKGHLSTCVHWNVFITEFNHNY